MRRTIILINTMLAAAVVAGFGCNNGETGSVKGFLTKAFEKGARGVPVMVEKPELVEESVTITVPGILAASDRIEVKLESDARIDSFLVDVGDRVTRGQDLFQIARDDQKLRIAQLRAEQKELQANLEKNSYFLRNRDRLLDEGRITTEQYDSLEDEVDKSEEDLERVGNQLATLEEQATGPTAVDSPAAGVVQSKLNAAGGVAVAGTPIVTIVSNDPMIVTFRLASYEARTVRRGKEVSVRLTDLPGELFTATVTSIGAELDRDTNTFEVKASLPNPQGILKAGMNAFVEFTGAEKQKFLTISASAVITDRRRHYVYTVVQGTAHKVRVIPREIRGGTAEIVEGLSTNDVVVIKGSEKLSDGTVVDIWSR